MNIFLTCHSYFWTSNERRVYEDVLLLRKLDINVTVSCLEKSFLSEKLKEENVDCCHLSWGIRHQNVLSYIKNFKWNANKTSYDMVICYDLHSLVDANFLFRKQLKCVFILKHFKSIQSYTLSFIQRVCLKRVDLVLVPSQQLFENARAYLPVSSRRIKKHFGGNFLEKENFVDVEKQSLEIRKLLKVGIVVEKDEKDCKDLFQALKGLNSVREKSGVNIEVTLYLTVSWKGHDLYDRVQKELTEFFYLYNIKFVDNFSLKEPFKDVHIYLSHQRASCFDDWIFKALSENILVVCPFEVENSFEGCIQSYTYGNPKNLAENLFSHSVRFKKRLSYLLENHHSFIREYGTLNYSKEFLEFFDRSLKKRKRLASRFFRI